MTDAAASDASNTAQGMPSVFDPKPVEAHWYPFWLQHNLFAGRTPQPGEKSFCITIPPPNVTGALHLGHALQHSIHDCLLRYHRMKGTPTLCVPGTDHASIATQVKVEQKIAREEGLTRHDLGREEFLKRAWTWKTQFGGTIIEQMKALGCSYDWSRERFTMDEGYTRAVLLVFKAWHDAGYIYRGLRLVNWSSGAQTTVSDLEIDYREVAGSIWHLRYPVDGTDEFITVATTRPETMLGDTAVAVHPADPRYQHLIGRQVRLPLMDRLIPIVSDPMVDREFGSGVVKITPAHDPNDYEVGQRHNLPMISVIGFDARMTPEAGAYAGMTREEARDKVVADLQGLGLLEKIEPYTHSVGHCARTGVVIEPLLSEQWFVAMKELARPVADAIKMNRVHYRPERFAQTSLEWLENIRDWCISRQLWWGHRIPVYYGPNGEVKVSVEPITEEGWRQDEDVLDTWFSAALWPFTVLGWPDHLQTEWYPTSVLITGRDILNLWVSRMILTSLNFCDDQMPFHDVLVHPTVQDCFGLRMSKSLGTGIDPMGLIATYGADATRFGLLQLATNTQDVRFIDLAEVQLGEKFVRDWIAEHKGSKSLPLVWNDDPTKQYPQMQQARNFANKIWNAARFVLTTGPLADEPNPRFGLRVYRQPTLAEMWIITRLSLATREVTAALDAYEFDRAASRLYEFIWGDFCDWFVELAKPGLRTGDEQTKSFLVETLETSMRLLHPFMPFLSEEIWQRLPKAPDAPLSLSLAQWQVPTIEDYEAEAERNFTLVQDAIRAARNLRAEAKLPPGQKVKFLLAPTSDTAQHVFQREGRDYLMQLANASEVELLAPSAARPQNALSAALPDLEVLLPLEGLIDKDKESARLRKEIEAAEKDLARVAGKLGNAGFRDKAPTEVIAKEEAKRAELEASLIKLRERLNALG